MRLTIPAGGLALIDASDRVVGRLLAAEPDGRHWSVLVEQPDGRQRRLWVAGRLMQAWARDVPA